MRVTDMLVLAITLVNSSALVSSLRRTCTVTHSTVDPTQLWRCPPHCAACNQLAPTRSNILKLELRVCLRDGTCTSAENGRVRFMVNETQWNVSVSFVLRTSTRCHPSVAVYTPLDPPSLERLRKALLNVTLYSIQHSILRDAFCSHNISSDPVSQTLPFPQGSTSSTASSLTTGTVTTARFAPVTSSTNATTSSSSDGSTRQGRKPVCWFQFNR